MRAIMDSPSALPCCRAGLHSAVRHWFTAWLIALALCLAGLPQARAQGAEDDFAYRIAPGDTLIGIGKRWLSDPADWPQLQQRNRIANPRRLVPGSTLHIPLQLLARRASVAEVVFVRGDAQVEHAAAGATKPLAVGDAIRSGDVVRTSGDATLTMRFDDGSRLLLPPNSRLDVLEMFELKATRAPVVRLRLNEGEAQIQVTPRPAGTHFELRTPAVNLGVRGTDFRGRVDDAGAQSRLEVLDGKVAAQAGSAVRGVDGGFGLLAQAGRPLPEPARLPAAPDLSATPPLLEAVPLRFAWPAVSGAAGYRARIFDAQHPQAPLLDGRFDGPGARFADLPDGRYALFVRALDANALQGADASSAFVLKARPEPPLGMTPADGAVSRGESATLQWARPVVAERYRLQIARDAGFTDLVVDDARLVDNRFVVPLAPGAYHWRVATIAAGDDQGPFSPAHHFEQRALPPAPEPQPPQVGSDGLTFRWKAPDAGQSVQFQLARDVNFEQIVSDQITQGAEGTLADPAAGTYYLRLRTIDADGFEGPFGAAQQVEVPPSKWWLLAPLLLLVLIL